MLSKNTTLKSGIYRVMLFAFIAGFIGSCEDTSKITRLSESNIEEDELSENQFLKQNVVFADARVRSLSKTAYVREIVLIDFSETGKMPNSVIFDGTTYFDDGSYNDLEANDGIYASAAEFSHSERIPYNKELTVRSVMEQIVIDYDFQHKDRMEYITTAYSMPANSKGIAKTEANTEIFKAEVSCDVEFNTCGCRADRWGLCDCCCITYSNCSFHVEVGF